MDSRMSEFKGKLTFVRRAAVADLELANRGGTRNFSLINIHLFIKIDQFYCIH